MTRTELLTYFQHTQSPRYSAEYRCDRTVQAAVLLPLVTINNKLHLLFTERAMHLKHHPGQISFPGGKYEEEDGDLLTTALRETHEEVGIRPNQVDIIGELPTYTTVSNYRVKPYIGFIENGVNLRLDKNEVNSAFTVPLDYLINTANHFSITRHTKHEKHIVYFIKWQSYTIWGVTAAFVQHLATHINHN